MSAPNSPKTKRGANGKFLPKPLLFHLRLPNSKTNEPKFWQILSSKNSFAKTSSALFRHLPEILRAEHQRKMSFPFSRKNSPPPYQRSKEHFSLVLPSEARQWRNDSFHIGILLEKSSDFVQETQPVFGKGIFAKIRSVAKRRDGGFRQNSPRVFEIQKERAGREAGVYDEYIIQNFVLRANREANNYQYLT
jgi:hypothetical protein